MGNYSKQGEGKRRGKGERDHKKAPIVRTKLEEKLLVQMNEMKGKGMKKFETIVKKR